MPDDFSILEPAADKLHRAVYLLRGTRLRPEASLLVAARSHPLERFIGAAAWWVEGNTGRFQLTCQPGVDRQSVTRGLIRGVIERGTAAGLENLQYADLLSEQSEGARFLEAEGFEHLRSERFFEVDYPDIWKRVNALYEKHKNRIPPSWRTVSASDVAPEVVAPFISPHRLMPPTEVREYWQAEKPDGFDLNISNVLFAGAEAFGAVLLRRVSDVLVVDILVVQHESNLLRSLGELCLFHHGVSRLPVDGPVRALHFRSGETEHRQTANLAIRMGGRELARRNVYARRLAP